MNKSYSVKKENSGKEFLKFIFLIFIMVIVRYRLPPIASILAFYSTLIVFFFSKKNYFWIAFFLFLKNAPGGLFQFDGTIPAIGLGAKSIDFQEFFMIIAFVKSLLIYRSKKMKIFYMSSYLPIFIYIIFLWVTTFYFGISTMKILRTLRFQMAFTMLFSMPVLLHDKDKMIKFMILIFKLAILIFTVQVVEYITGDKLIYYLGQTYSLSGFSANESYVDQQDFSGSLIRIAYGVHLLLLAMILSLFSYGKHFIKSKYLNLLTLAAGYGVFFLSGTRGWVIASTFLIGMWMLFVNRDIKKNSTIIVIFFVTLLMLFMLSSSIRNQLSMSWGRLQTLQSLAEGDKTAGGTLSRLTDRLYNLQEKVEKNLLIGLGYSDEFYENMDMHVANLTIILCGGILGIILWIMHWFTFCSKIFFLNQSLSPHNKYARRMLSFIFGLLTLLIIHSSSVGLFNFVPSPSFFFPISIFYAASNLFYWEAKKEEEKLREIAKQKALQELL